MSKPKVTDAALRDFLAGWEDELPPDVTFDQLIEMAADAIEHGLGLTWIPSFCNRGEGPLNSRGCRFIPNVS